MRPTRRVERGVNLPIPPLQQAVFEQLDAETSTECEWRQDMRPRIARTWCPTQQIFIQWEWPNSANRFLSSLRSPQELHLYLLHPREEAVSPETTE